VATLLIDTETRRRLDTVGSALTTEFADLSPTLVVDAVDGTALELLRDATIVDYVPVLTHRLARDRLLLHRASLAENVAPAVRAA